MARHGTDSRSCAGDGRAAGRAGFGGCENLAHWRPVTSRTGFFPESISAAPSGELFVSSLTTGEIVRFSPGSSSSAPFVAAGVNVGTAGVMVDSERGVLWACAVDLSFETASELRAFDLTTGALVGSYEMPNGGVCADIALAGGDVQ